MDGGVVILLFWGCPMLRHHPRFLAFVLFLAFVVYPFPTFAQETFNFGEPADFSAYLAQIRAASSPEQAQAMVDRLWDSLIAYERVPLVFDSGDIVFLYRGKAQSVQWRGDFSQWQPQSIFSGSRVRSTDLWIMRMRLPLSARIEYKIVLNDDFWIIDPANVHIVASGSGPNNELRMPAFTSTDVVQESVPDHRGVVRAPVLIDSANLGYTVSYQVYTPYGYEQLDNLTAFYVLDGNDFAVPSKGDLPHALDVLIASGAIQPSLAVLISNRDPADQLVNRRETEFLENNAYADFIADELAPEIEAQYRVNATQAGRVIMGVSYGGLASAYIAAYRPDVFDQAALLSPSFWASQRLNALPLNQLHGGRVFVSGGFPDWDVGDLTPNVEGIRQLGFDVLFIQTVEGHSWNTWRALLDEMLIYFVGTDQAGG